MAIVPTLPFSGKQLHDALKKLEPTIADRAPLPSDDETQGYAVGSRWQWQGQEWVAVGVNNGNARWVNTVEVTPQAFGARGDGVADDTAAIRRAMSYAGPVIFSRGTYRITSPIAVDHPLVPIWLGEGAEIVYDGPDTQDSAVLINVPATGLYGRVEGITFNGGLRARQAVEFASTATAGTPAYNRPNLALVDVVGCRARSNDDATAMVSGVVVSGGWNRVTFTRVGGRDIFLGPAVTNSMDRSAAGIRTLFGGGTNLRPLSIALTDVWAENVWAEKKDGASQEADGISIFQDTGAALPSGDALTINGYVYRNVGNRAIKLHSAARAIISNVQGYLSSSVLPFSGMMRTAHIDAQQGGAIISNVEVYLDGVAPPYLIQNYTEQADHARNGAVTSGIKVFMSPATPEDMVVLYSRNGNLPAPAVGETRLSLSDVVITGRRVRNVARFGVRGAGTCYVALSNIVADATSSFVDVEGTTNDSAMTLVAGTCIQTGAAVPLVRRSDGSALDSDWNIGSMGCFGFSDVSAIDLRAGETMRVRRAASGAAPNSASALFLEGSSSVYQSFGSAGGAGNTMGLYFAVPGAATRGGFSYVLGADPAEDFFAYRIGSDSSALRVQLDRLLLGSNYSTAPAVIRGDGTPEGRVSAAPGSQYLRQGSGAGPRLYIHEGASYGNTGWVAK